MTLLAIESATDLVGVALVGDDGAVAERVHLGGRAHAELLVPAIEEVCAVSGCVIGDVDTLAVDVGPGLFTGLRVGVATAKALAQALGIGVVPVLSLDVLAAAAVAEASAAGEPPGAVASVVDARRGEVFAAVYRFDRSGPRQEGEVVEPDPSAVRVDRAAPLAPEDLVEWLVAVAAEAGPLLVVGDGAVRYLPLLAVQAGLDVTRAERIASPPPRSLADLAGRRLAAGIPTVPALSVAPEYRRGADARVNFEQRPSGAPAPAGGDGPGR